MVPTVGFIFKKVSVPFRLYERCEQKSVGAQGKCNPQNMGRGWCVFLASYLTIDVILSQGQPKFRTMWERYFFPYSFVRILIS